MREQINCVFALIFLPYEPRHSRCDRSRLVALTGFNIGLASVTRDSIALWVLRRVSRLHVRTDKRFMFCVGNAQEYPSNQNLVRFPSYAPTFSTSCHESP